VAGLASTGHGNITPFSSPIPWRKAGLRYTSDEIYFDVSEKLKAVVGPYVHFNSLMSAADTETKVDGTERGRSPARFLGRSILIPSYRVRPTGENFIERPLTSFTKVPRTSS